MEENSSFSNDLMHVKSEFVRVKKIYLINYFTFKQMENQKAF